MRTKEYYREYRLRNSCNTVHAKLDKIIAFFKIDEQEPTKPLEATKPKKAVKAPKDVKDAPQPTTVAAPSDLNVCVRCGKEGYQGYQNSVMVWVCKDCYWKQCSKNLYSPQAKLDADIASL